MVGYPMHEVEKLSKLAWIFDEGLFGCARDLGLIGTLCTASSHYYVV